MKDITVCDYHKRENEPCYGELDSYNDGEYWITVCEGHQAVPNDGAYIPKDAIRRWIFSQQNAKIRRLEEENKMLWEMVKLADKKLLEKESQEDDGQEFTI